MSAVVDEPVRVWEFGNLAVDIVREVDEGVETFEVRMLTVPGFDAHWGRAGAHLLASQTLQIDSAIRDYLDGLDK